jgi:ferredoxin
MTQSPYYDPSRCNRCGLCVLACPCHAVSLTDDGVVFACDAHCIHSPDCPTLRHCLWPCEEVCPTGAIQCPFDIVPLEEDDLEASDQP